MANVYTPPGTTIQENNSPVITPLLASAADICLIGVAGTPATSVQPITTTDVIILTGSSPQVLPTLQQLNSDAVLVSVVSVTDVLNPAYGTPLGAGYVVTIDYTVNVGQGPPDGSHGTITRVGGGNIVSGTLVAVTYTYLPIDYWNPIRLFDIGSVESRFGPAWATAVSPSTGQTYFTGINSQLSMAARLAFANGAQSVICQPLFSRATPGNPTTAQGAPGASAVGNATTWADTLYVLRPIADLDIIVPIVGVDGVNVSDSAVLSIFQSVQTHLAFMNSQQQYIVAILGEDGTSSAAEAAGLLTTIRGTHAPALQSNFGNALSCQMALINNSVFQMGTPGGQNTLISVGGQYAAAAIAGAIGGRAVSSSLTHQSISGFVGITDPRTPSDKNADAGAGLMVLQQLGGAVQVRHSITLDIVNGQARSELSVVRAKFLMIESIMATINNQIIGSIIADGNSPFVVSSAISGVLALLQGARAIVGYSTVTAALTSLTPTTITATFSYKPAFPLNYVQVTFSIDLTTNSVTVVNDGTNPVSGG